MFVTLVFYTPREMDWNNFFAVVPVEAQAILQEKIKIKKIISVLSSTPSVSSPAGWLSGFDFDLRKQMNNLKKKSFSYSFIPFLLFLDKNLNLQGVLSIQGSGVYSGVSALKFQLIHFPDF